MHPEINRTILEKYKEAGKIAKETLALAKKLIKPGAKLFDVVKALDNFILSKGFQPAFPSQISINEIAAHYCPELNEETTFEEGQIIKVDVGISNQGFIADTATTIILGTNQEAEQLKEAALSALNKAIDILEPNLPLNEIGKVIEAEIKEFDAKPIRNLTGHALEPWILHAKPSIFNIYVENFQEKIRPNMVLAIEPFTTFGQGYVTVKGKPTIFALSKQVSSRNIFTRKALLLLKERKNLPFALWWLQEKLGVKQAEIAIRDLRLKQALEEHAPLVEQSLALVAQEEHTIVIDADGKKHVITM